MTPPNQDDLFTERKLYLLDAMALVYRAHFAFMRNPIRTSTGVNTSALYGFANTLLDLLENQGATHLAVATDTSDPTFRHELFPEYKAGREAMPEELAAMIPHVYRLCELLGVPVLRYPGWEADDIIGTVAAKADEEGYTTYMVTPDKDYGQLVGEKTFMVKPGRAGGDAEVLGLPEIQAKWGIERADQVVDILGLMGDSSDNIPGVPGIGEKTAMKLVGQFGDVETLLANTDQLKGKQKEKVETHADQARLSRQLALISREAPVTEHWDDYRIEGRDDEGLKSFMVEFEFNALGKRLFGNDFAAGRGAGVKTVSGSGDQGDLFASDLKTLATTTHDYQAVTEIGAARNLVTQLLKEKRVAFDLETTSLDVRVAEIVGVALSSRPGTGWFLRFPDDAEGHAEWVDLLQPLMQQDGTVLVGHNLKFDLGVLRWRGLSVTAPIYDTMLAHFLVEPDSRHGMDLLAEQYLGWKCVPITELIGEKKSEQISMREVPLDRLTEYAVEDADITLQLCDTLAPLVKEFGQEEILDTMELPLVKVLVEMEYAGIRLDLSVLDDIRSQLDERIGALSVRIEELAGRPFNLNSPKQLGEILFDELKIVDKPKKTKTGQYSTNEQVLQGLVERHEIVGAILDYREITKLKNTYVDALPNEVFPGTGRVHTHYSQTGAATGRLSSNNPNLQNIPVRTDLGQEIRRAFVAADPDHVLLAADYSQIELRVMADMSGDEAMRAAFSDGLDIHAATAARVYGVPLEDVTSDMRRKAKMVNFGIIYGISGFGLAQRLGIPRKEGAELIEQYFTQYPGVKAFMDQTITTCQEKGYVETRSGRRRRIREITSSNHTVRSGAERVAINSPIQGTAADMIKLAMIRIEAALREAGLATRMLLQVHDELIFDVPKDELEQVQALVASHMQEALTLEVPIEVGMDTGDNWLEAH